MIEKKELKIIVAHPGRQHSYRLAAALKKNDLLYKYITMIYDKNTIMMKIAKKIISTDNKKRAQKRRLEILKNDDVVLFYEIFGYIEAFLYRKNFAYEAMRIRDAHLFGKRVAKYALKNKVDMIVCYDSNSFETFNYLKKNDSNIIKVMDVSIASRNYMKSIYEKEIKNSGKQDIKVENIYLWNEHHMKKMISEIKDADYFLVASNFVKKSLEYNGINEERIFVVPYGANVLSKNEKQFNTNVLKFLFVGQVNSRKGIQYLLESFSNLDGDAELTIVGNYSKDSWYVKKYSKIGNINFVGSVTLDKMKNIYEKSHVFVLDTFAEGMAQVGIEALACGLPIITTFNSGLDRVVDDGKNGLIISPGNVAECQKAMQWFIDNKEQLPYMSNIAKKSVENVTWDTYEENVIAALKEMYMAKEGIK